MRNILIIAAVFAFVAGSGVLERFGRQDKPIAIPDAAPGKSLAAPRPVKENVVAYHTGDQAMNAAKKKARETLPRFLELIDAGTAGTYTLKFPLTQNGETEHIWMQLTDYRDGTFVGLLANDPVNGTKYKMGDEMKVASADVEDWMIRTDELIYGGYTARVALAAMPREQAEKYRIMFRD
jgi:uncharacterized protein YegJ (DUF2314 family)